MRPERPIVEYETTLGGVNPPNVRLVLSVAALALTALGWVWLIMCFTATYSAWWNSGWVFVIAFGLALALAAGSFFVRGSPVATGIAVVACCLSGLSLALSLLIALG